ncbi:MAG: glycoside hydrolase family 15 protein [Oligoflexia bacterium]|nr:glycoside hydrolase family 15 protein [Oligoflexia bacterium]
MYPYGLIGNSQASALVNQNGSIDWLCLPRPDSPPVFGRLLDPDGGHFSVQAVGKSTSVQEYLPNSAVLTTTVATEDGSVFKITDFCPRFYQHGRIFRPISLFRIIEPVRGSPSIVVSCKPVNGWDKEYVKPVRGNSHLRFELAGEQLRLTTNMSITYLCEETPFVLKETTYFGLTWSFAIEEDLIQISNRFLEQTIDYWNGWVKHCSIPSLYQKETIRAALTLKLHCYEDTGAILAALTTSLPEEKAQIRNWDYRFCWLRDAYFVLSAFHNLGHFEEMEGFIKFLLNIAEKHEFSRERLHPVYKLDQSLPLPELEHHQWQGFNLSKPVRSNNQAAEHIQNDVYGEMVLTLAPIFFDERFRHLRTKDHESLLEHLVKLCVNNISKPDAGLWETRSGWQEHTFSNLMCWAGIDRAIKLKERGFLKNLKLDLEQSRKAAEVTINSAVKDGVLRNGPQDSSFDASFLQLSTLRYPDKELCKQTTLRIQKELSWNNTDDGSSFLYRYLRSDDFGKPKSTFVICSFWLVQALASLGLKDEALKVMEKTNQASNSIGLFSEHYIPDGKIQMGNFPQAYSHVGLINAAFAVSPPWNEIL